MINLDIAHRRLHNQHITWRTLETPQALVEWLGAVQAQDFAAAKWALGLRLQGVTDDDIEQAFTDGAILRTHVMRRSLPIRPLPSPAGATHPSVSLPSVPQWVSHHDPTYTAARLPGGRCN